MSEALTLSLPADLADVQVLRTVAMAVVGRRDAPIETVSDAGLAIDEAAGLLLAIPGASRLRAAISDEPAATTVVLSTDATSPSWPPTDFEDSLAGTVLQSITSEIRFAESTTGAEITLKV